MSKKIEFKAYNSNIDAFVIADGEVEATVYIDIDSVRGLADTHEEATRMAEEELMRLGLECGMDGYHDLLRRVAAAYEAAE